MGFELKMDIIANKVDHEASPGCTSRQGKNNFSPGSIGVGIQRERGGGAGGLMRPEEKTHEVANKMQTSNTIIHLYTLYINNVYSCTMMYKVFWQYRQDATIPMIKTL